MTYHLMKSVHTVTVKDRLHTPHPAALPHPQLLPSGWKLGGVLNTYLSLESAGDRFVGRVRALSPQVSKNFCVLPPTAVSPQHVARRCNSRGSSNVCNVWEVQALRSRSRFCLCPPTLLSKFVLSSRMAHQSTRVSSIAHYLPWAPSRKYDEITESRWSTAIRWRRPLLSRNRHPIVDSPCVESRET